jgi:aryl-alcohol dehydrogenase-like predicted oxidoreductase
MKNKKQITRREFIRTTATSAAVVGAGSALGLPLLVRAAEEEKSAAAKMPVRLLGQTGQKVCLFSLGGQGLLETPGQTDGAVAIINRALDLGVNYCDTAAAYGHGCSQQYYGEVMKTRRSETYLATKAHSRDYNGAMRMLETSLKDLQTDHLDCWQIHNVRTEQDMEKIFAPNGALKAFIKARDEKTVRYIGITGHRNPFVLKKCLEQFPFDTILMALNAADKHLPGPDDESSFIQNLLPTAVEQKLGIIGMKVPALGKILRPDGLATMQQAMGYVLTLPVSTVIIGINTIAELEENVGLAKSFQPLKPVEMAKLEELTKPYFTDATFFKRQKGY